MDKKILIRTKRLIKRGFAMILLPEKIANPKDVTFMKWNKLTQMPWFPTQHRIKLLLRCIKEKILGLDFSMPDRMYDRGREDGAMYLATEDEMLDKFFSFCEGGNLLDVGSGKGYVLWRAAEAGFSKVGGVEYDEKLYKICRRNLRSLMLEDRVEVTCCNAVEFRGYGDYDVFYFFNPFAEAVMEQVMENIVKQCAGKEIVVIYYRPRYVRPIEQFVFLEKIGELYNEERGYNANIYRGKIPKNA